MHIFNEWTIITQSLNIKEWKLLELQITQTRHPKSVVEKWTDWQTDGRTFLHDGRSKVSNGPWPLQIDGVNLVRLIPQAHFYPITPYCTNPNLTLTSLNTAIQIASLIMIRGHVRTDRQMDGQTDRWSGPTTRPALAKVTQVKMNL